MERTMRLALFVFALAGCAPEEEKDTELPPVANDTDDEPVVCEGTPPVIEELTVGDLGKLYDFEDGPSPALVVRAKTEDEDGDLHQMGGTYWYDDVIDGVVDTSDAGSDGGYIRMNEEDCGTSSANYGIVFEVDGNRFEYETTYEFAMEVYDAAGLISERVVASGTTPGPAR